MCVSGHACAEMHMHKGQRATWGLDSLILPCGFWRSNSGLMASTCTTESSCWLHFYFWDRVLCTLRLMAALQSQTFKYWSLNKPVQKLYLSCKPNSSSSLNTVYYVFINFEHAVWFINVLDLFIVYYFVYIPIKTDMLLSKFIVVYKPDKIRLAVATSRCLNTCEQMCYFQVCSWIKMFAVQFTAFALFVVWEHL